MAKCNRKCEVYSRVVGYYRPVQDYNPGKVEEFNDRVVFDPDPKSSPHEKYQDDEKEKMSNGNM